MLPFIANFGIRSHGAAPSHHALSRSSIPIAKRIAPTTAARVNNDVTTSALRTGAYVFGAVAWRWTNAATFQKSVRTDRCRSARIRRRARPSALYLDGEVRGDCRRRTTPGPFPFSCTSRLREVAASGEPGDCFPLSEKRHSFVMFRGRDPEGSEISTFWRRRRLGVGYSSPYQVGHRGHRGHCGDQT